MAPIDNDFPRIREIDGHFAADVGLDLSGSPIGLMGVFHKHSRFK